MWLSLLKSISKITLKGRILAWKPVWIGEICIVLAPQVQVVGVIWGQVNQGGSIVTSTAITYSNRFPGSVLCYTSIACVHWNLQSSTFKFRLDLNWYFRQVSLYLSVVSLLYRSKVGWEMEKQFCDTFKAVSVQQDLKHSETKGVLFLPYLHFPLVFGQSMQ